jgi:hypothetical protein
MFRDGRSPKSTNAIGQFFRRALATAGRREPAERRRLDLDVRSTVSASSSATPAPRAMAAREAAMR